MSDMVISDSILFIPLAMSFNGWIRIYTYDLKTKKEVLYQKNDKEFGIYSRGHTYIKNKSAFCMQGTIVDDGFVKEYKITNEKFELKKTFKYKRADYVESIILKDLK